jgi:hypothetical protein
MVPRSVRRQVGVALPHAEKGATVGARHSLPRRTACMMIIREKPPSVPRQRGRHIEGDGGGAYKRLNLRTNGFIRVRPTFHNRVNPRMSCRPPAPLRPVMGEVRESPDAYSAVTTLLPVVPHWFMGERCALACETRPRGTCRSGSLLPRGSSRWFSEAPRVAEPWPPGRCRPAKRPRRPELAGVDQAFLRTRSSTPHRWVTELQCHARCCGGENMVQELRL